MADEVAEAGRLLTDVGAKRLTDPEATAETALRLLQALLDRLEAAEKRMANCPHSCRTCDVCGEPE